MPPPSSPSAPAFTPEVARAAGSRPRITTRVSALLDGPWRLAFAMTVASLVMWRGVLSSPSTTTVGVGGRDFHFYIWSLDVIARGMFRWGPGLRTSVIYPAQGGVPLTADTTIVGFGFLLAPVTRLFGPVVSLNLVMISALPLNAAGAFWAYRRVLRCGCGGSVLGAVLYAASPYVMGHSLGHANLVHVWWLPVSLGLIVPAVTGATQRRSVLRASVGGLVLGAGMLIGSELVAIGALVVLPWLTVLFVRRRPRLHWRALVGAGVCAVVVSAPIVWGTVGDANHYTGTHQPPNVYVTDVSNIVVPTSDSIVGSIVNPTSLSSRWTGNGAETTGYVSVFGVSLIVLVLQRRVRSPARPFAALAAWGLVLSLGPFLHIGGLVTDVPLPPGMVLAVLPLLGSVLPGRISFVIFAALGAVVAVAFDRTSGESVVETPDVMQGSRRTAVEQARYGGVFLDRRRRLGRALALATVLATLPPLKMATFDVASTFGLQLLTRASCGGRDGTSNAVAIPRDEGSYDALSWQVRGRYEVDLVRARYFTLDYPLHGRPLLLDQYVVPRPGAGAGPTGRVVTPTAEPSEVVAQLRTLKTNCVVAAPEMVDPVTRSSLDGIFGSSHRAGGLEYWSVH